jgi:hypothetical protein
MNRHIIHNKHKEMNKLQKFPYSTFTSYWAALRETERMLAKENAEIKRMLAEENAETKRMLAEENAETKRFLRELFAEREQAVKEQERILAEKAAEREQTVKEQERISDERAVKLDRKISDLFELIGGIGNNNGELAEEHFYSAFRKNKNFLNETYEKVLRNQWIKNEQWHTEFDLLLLNGKSAAILEVKYRASHENINIEKLISRVEPFKALFPEYKDRNIYLGVAAMSFNRYLAKHLHEAGIVTIHQEGRKMVVWDNDVRVF